MSGPEVISLTLGAISVVLAIVLSRRTDKVVKALSGLEFDEKRAMISRYCAEVARGGQDDEYLRQMEADVSALAHLKDYIPEDARERLVRGDLLPALQRLESQQPVPKLASVQRMVDETLKFGVCDDALKQLQSDLAKS